MLTIFSINLVFLNGSSKSEMCGYFDHDFTQSLTSSSTTPHVGHVCLLMQLGGGGSSPEYFIQKSKRARAIKGRSLENYIGI